MRGGEKGDLESECGRIVEMKWTERDTESGSAVTQKTVNHTDHLKTVSLK